MGMLRRLTVLIVAVLLAGCYDAQTDNPIGTTSGLVQDDALIGIWKLDTWRRETGEYVHIFRRNERELTLLWIEGGESRFASYSDHRLTIAKLGTNRFINVVDRTGEADETGDKKPLSYRPILYTLRRDGRILTFYLANDDKVAAAIERGALQGKVEKHQDQHSDGTPYTVYDKILITAAPAELDTFMAKPEAADLFQVFERYKKID